MNKLVNGLHTFHETYFAKNKALFHKLATEGQKPTTLFITCSDSRVVPELITSSAPGDLFIVRNVGNVVPPDDPSGWGGVSSAIEYAVEVLNVEDIIVCGHTQCGAMAAILNPASMEHLPRVKRWLDPTQSRLNALLSERYRDHDPKELLTVAIQENVLIQLEHLRTFPFITKRLEEGRLNLAGWVFNIDRGEIVSYAPKEEQFLPFARSSESPAPVADPR